MPPKCVRVESASAGGTSVDVYFRLKGVEHDMWELGSPTGEPFDRWVHKFPFGIGRTRTADESIGLGDGEDSWLTVTSGKVSRRHAVIFYDEDTQQFKIRCHSDNGVDVNRACGWQQTRGAAPCVSPHPSTCAHAHAHARVHVQAPQPTPP